MCASMKARSAVPDLSESQRQPRLHASFAVGITPATGYDQVIMVTDDWGIKEYVSGTVQTDLVPSLARRTRPFTGTILADILYLNREDGVPVYRTVGGTNFADLPNWDGTHKAASLRA